LVDLLSAMETLVARGGQLCAELTDEARRLADVAGAASVSPDDPRFSDLMRSVNVEARSAKELAERLLARRQDGPDPKFAASEVRRLRERIEEMPRRKLEEELIQIFASTEKSRRNCDILIGYYGWRDGRRHTLAEIGARYDMTRERTRQICAKLVKRKNPEAILAPVMDRALAFIEKRLPCPAEKLQRDLVEAGITAIGMSLENVADAAALLGRPVGFCMVRAGCGRLAVRPTEINSPTVVIEAAKKAVYYHGLTTVKRVKEAAADKFPGRLDLELTRQIVQMIDGFRWLDHKCGWFCVASIHKHGLPRAVEKILAVAGSIRVVELRAALGRGHRPGTAPLPQRVLLEFCRQMSGVTVEGDRIAADPPLDWTDVLTGVEKELVVLLQEHGPVMERGVLEDLCVARGMNRFSFHAFIASSVVIAQYGHSVYGLLGANVATRTVRSLIRHRRAAREPVRVLDGHGTTADGKPWLSYRLSKAASTYAVVTVPSAMKDLVHGRFELRSPDGNRVGTLAAKDGRAWGLGAFLRRKEAQMNDHVLITLDLDKRTAVIAINGESPVDGRR
jgi:hypothetical protein